MQIPIAENNLEALHEAIRLEYSIYDILYVTLARRTGAVLLTLDGPLATIAEKEGIEIVKL
jgi:predicted nucleic acid-binding protein